MKVKRIWGKFLFTALMGSTMLLLNSITYAQTDGDLNATSEATFSKPVAVAKPKIMIGQWGINHDSLFENQDEINSQKSLYEQTKHFTETLKGVGQLIEQAKTSAELNPESIVPIADDSKSDQGNMTNKLAVMLGLISLTGAIASNVSNQKSAQNDPFVRTMDLPIHSRPSGIYLEASESDKLLSLINMISVKQYMVDKNGMLLENPLKNKNIKGSSKATEVIDRLIESGKPIDISIKDFFWNMDNATNSFKKQKVENGLSVGDESTGYSVMLQRDNNEPDLKKAIILLHELSHTLGDENQSISIENQIRKEIGQVARVEQTNDKNLFINYYGEDSGYLEDYVATVPGAVYKGLENGEGIVEYNGEIYKFKLGDEENKIYEDNNKVVLPEKMFRYVLNLDIDAATEDYLRKYFEQIQAVIKWDPVTRTVNINYQGQDFNVVPGNKEAPGEYKTYINKNDRTVITKEELQKLVSEKTSGTDASGDFSSDSYDASGDYSEIEDNTSTSDTDTTTTTTPAS